MKRSMLVLVSLALLVFASNAGGQTCAVPPSGMVGWWPGDGNANDISGKGNHGTLQGDATFAAGEVGQAFSFDGDGDYVAVPDDATLDITGQITIDAWVNPSAFPATGDATIATKALAYYFQVDSGGYLRVYHYTTTPPGYHSSTIPISSGQWQHVAYTYDGSNVTFFINGNPINSISVTGPIQTSNTYLGIGMNLDASGNPYSSSTCPTACKRPFEGLIDEVEVFNRALTPSEIEAIYSAGSVGKLKKVEINIKPGSDPNSINTCSQGATPVTIWGSACLATLLDNISLDQLTLASAEVKTVGKSGRSLCSVKDVGQPDSGYFDNYNPTPDGYADITCHFVTFGLDVSDSSAEAGLVITGCDNPSDGCTTGEAGYFVITATDTVNIVRECE